MTGIIVHVSGRVQKMYVISAQAMSGGGWNDLALCLKAVR